MFSLTDLLSGSSASPRPGGPAGLPVTTAASSEGPAGAFALLLNAAELDENPAKGPYSQALAAIADQPGEGVAALPGMLEDVPSSASAAQDMLPSGSAEDAMDGVPVLPLPDPNRAAQLQQALETGNNLPAGTAVSGKVLPQMPAVPGASAEAAPQAADLARSLPGAEARNASRAELPDSGRAIRMETGLQDQQAPSVGTPTEPLRPMPRNVLADAVARAAEASAEARAGGAAAASGKAESSGGGGPLTGSPTGSTQGASNGSPAGSANGSWNGLTAGAERGAMERSGMGAPLADSTRGAQEGAAVPGRQLPGQPGEAGARAERPATLFDNGWRLSDLDNDAAQGAGQDLRPARPGLQPEPAALVPMLDRRSALERQVSNAQNPASRAEAPALTAVDDATGTTSTPGWESFDSQLRQQSVRTVLPAAQARDLSALAERIEMLVHRRGDLANLSLNLGDLGDVEISVRMESRQAHVSFVVQDQAVREALEQQLPRLRAMLAESGLELGEFGMEQPDTSGGETASRQHNGAPTSGSEVAGPSGTDDGDPSREGRASGSDRLLDAFA